MNKYRLRLRLVCLAAIIIGYACCPTLKSVYYDFDGDGIDKPVKIAFLSDVHNTLYGKGQRELISAVDEFGADIVLFGGDLFDENINEKNSWVLVDALAGEYPCFYAVGNHETRRGKAKEIKAAMAEHGVTVLEDMTEVMEINGQKIRICGTENSWDEKAASQLDETYSVLLHHYPADFPEMSQKGFDLILAGHAHGGQWRIPQIMNGFLAPGEWFFPEYAGGYYSGNGSEMIVSRGLCRNFIPRIFNRPEIILITIK